MLSSKGGRKHWTWAALPVLGARLRNFFSEPAIELDEAWLEHVSILGCFADCGGNIDSLSSVAWPNDDQIKEAVARRSCAASGPGTTTLEKQIWLGAAYLPQLTGRTLALDKTLGEVVLARFQHQLDKSDAEGLTTRMMPWLEASKRKNWVLASASLILS